MSAAWHLIGGGFVMALSMLWDTLWALVLGFALSGIVQAFVSRRAMHRVLGVLTPATVTRASLLGAASSSCSYAASALAKSLFVRSADFTASMIFMFASTNLNIAIGLVIWLLVGWQFALAQFVGGAIMIALLAVWLPRLIPHRMQQAARDRLSDKYSGAASQQEVVEPLRRRLRRAQGWAAAASYMISDLTMLRKELIGGLVIAGFLTVGMPTSAWQALFITGHGFWSSLENSLLGPLIAIISFVCSVGNVPLAAAALWHGGISFGGTIAFIFADLITLPLVLIYRKYYGTALALRLLAVFWLVMSAAGLITEYLFSAAWLVPATHRAVAAAAEVSWNYTTVLNTVALIGFAALYWLHRHRARFSPGRDYAIDVVCGMQVETAQAPAISTHDGARFYFCSDRCKHRFDADPDRYTGHADAPKGAGAAGALDSTENGAVDPVCGMSFEPGQAPAVRHAGDTYVFGSTGCREIFAANPSRYAGDKRRWAAIGDTAFTANSGDGASGSKWVTQPNTPNSHDAQGRT